MVDTFAVCKLPHPADWEIGDTADLEVCATIPTPFRPQSATGNLKSTIINIFPSYHRRWDIACPTPASGRIGSAPEAISFSIPQTTIRRNRPRRLEAIPRFGFFCEKIPQKPLKNAREFHAKRVKIFPERGFWGAKPSIHWGFCAGTASAKITGKSG
jgi:hypothetical protein